MKRDKEEIKMIFGMSWQEIIETADTLCGLNYPQKSGSCHGFIKKQQVGNKKLTMLGAYLGNKKR